MGKIVLIAILQVTAYRPVPQQTKPECRDVQNCWTSIGDVPTKFGAAVSQDLLANGAVHYGDPIYIESIGWRIVNDTMNKRHHNAVDVMVWTHDEEKKIGVRHIPVYVAEGEPSALPGLSK